MDPRQAPAPERRLLRHRRTPQFARE
jgi:hypothetical protein